MKTRALATLLLLAIIPALQAQPPAPPPPEKYKVTLRYYIPSARDQHVLQYDALIRHLQKLDFEFDPPLDKRPDTDREDRGKNYMRGVVAAKHVPRLLDNPSAQTVLLVPFAPKEVVLPDEVKEADKAVTIRIELAGNLAADRQRELMNQTRVILRELGFK